jgi:hypothetical protein
MILRRLSAAALALSLSAGALAAEAAAPAATGPRTYRVKQTVSLGEIPEGAKDVSWWIAYPSDDRFQEVLDLSVTSAPGDWKVVREPDHGNRFLLVTVKNPPAGALDAVVEFTLRRRAVSVDVDPTKVGALTESHRRLFVDELRTDAPHMAVTPEIRALADKACGEEKNLALQAKALLAAVAANADHYSKDATKPKCSVGDATACLAKGGGCCTDLHSLFISMARARSIPSRLQMGYRLQEKNDGKEVDPGYRCWVEYFLPGHGWVPADIVEADAEGGLGPEQWFDGLTDRRLWLNEGRNFDLAGRRSKERVNTMVIGYAEIDGVPVRLLPEGDKPAQMTRKVLFTEVKM